MRRSLLVLPLLVLALPAAGQTKLAQQCAAFGEAQYRKLSPSVDRVMALDFPPPALERVDAKAGSQAVAAALTLRGRLTYRNGPPFETQFVCLLDAAQRPLFFYALPTLATRSAPTPVTRGGAPVARADDPGAAGGRANPGARPASSAAAAGAGAPAAAGERCPVARPGARPRRPPAVPALRWRAPAPGGPHAGPGTDAGAARADGRPERPSDVSSRSMVAARPGRARASARSSCAARRSRQRAVANASTSANGSPTAAAATSRRGASRSRRATCC